MRKCPDSHFFQTLFALQIMFGIIFHLQIFYPLYYTMIGNINNIQFSFCKYTFCQNNFSGIFFRPVSSFWIKYDLENLKI